MSSVQLALICKALGHPVRIAILQQLHQSRCCNGDIVNCLPLAQATVSQHIKCLLEADLICVTKQQQKHLYCVKTNTLQRFQQLLNEQIFTKGV